MRTAVIMFDSDGDPDYRLLLTEEQIKLLLWLRDNNYVEDPFLIMDDDITTVEI